MAIPHRLIYGFLSQSTDPLNLTIPWQISNRDGMFQMNYSREKAVETNLRAWAKTNWGERPMRFRFGLDAQRMLFEPSSVTKEVLTNNARDQLNRFFGFLKIVQLDVLTSDDNVDLPDNTVRFILVATFKDNENKKIKISEDVGI